jgi:hypothetical protein
LKNPVNQYVFGLPSFNQFNNYVDLIITSPNQNPRVGLIQDILSHFSGTLESNNAVRVVYNVADITIVPAIAN